MSLIDCKQGSHFLRQKSENRFFFEELGCAVVKWENGARKELCGQEKKEMGREGEAAQLYECAVY